MNGIEIDPRVVAEKAADRSEVLSHLRRVQLEIESISKFSPDVIPKLMNKLNAALNAPDGKVTITTKNQNGKHMVREWRGAMCYYLHKAYERLTSKILFSLYHQNLDMSLHDKIPEVQNICKNVDERVYFNLLYKTLFSTHRSNDVTQTQLVESFFLFEKVLQLSGAIFSTENMGPIPKGRGSYNKNNLPSGYKTVLCKYYLEGKCTSKNNCRYAHGEGELRPRADSPQNAASDPVPVALASPPPMQLPAQGKAKNLTDLLPSPKSETVKLSPMPKPEVIKMIVSKTSVPTAAPTV